MKRTALKRRAPLRARKTPLRARRPNIPGRRLAAAGVTTRRSERKAPSRLKKRHRNIPGRDPAYLARVRALPCGAHGLGRCAGRRHAHHPRHLGGGVGLKPPDAVAVSLCAGHHRQLHDVRGPFRGWKRDQLRAFQDELVAATRAALGAA